MHYSTIAAGLLSISNIPGRGTDAYHITGTVGYGTLIVSGDTCGVVMTDGFDFYDTFLYYDEENKSLHFANREVDLNKIALIGLRN